MRPGVPASVLTERLAFLLREAGFKLNAGEDVSSVIVEAQSLTNQLKEALR